MSKPNPEEMVGLVEFARTKKLDEARATCPVCKLPASLQDEIRDGARRGIERRYQIEYLRLRGYEIVDQDLTTHRNGRHDG